MKATSSFQGLACMIITALCLVFALVSVDAEYTPVQVVLIFAVIIVCTFAQVEVFMDRFVGKPIKAYSKIWTLIWLIANLLNMEMLRLELAIYQHQTLALLAIVIQLVMGLYLTTVISLCLVIFVGGIWEEIANLGIPQLYLDVTIGATALAIAAINMANTASLSSSSAIIWISICAIAGGFGSYLINRMLFRIPDDTIDGLDTITLIAGYVLEALVLIGTFNAVISGSSIAMVFLLIELIIGPMFCYLLANIGLLVAALIACGIDEIFRQRRNINAKRYSQDHE